MRARKVKKLRTGGSAGGSALKRPRIGATNTRLCHDSLIPSSDVPWIQLPEGPLLRVLEFLFTDKEGKAAFRNAGQVCTMWRQTYLEIALGDTATSRPERPPVPTLRDESKRVPADTSVAMTVDGTKSDPVCSQEQAATSRPPQALNRSQRPSRQPQVLQALHQNPFFALGPSRATRASGMPAFLGPLPPSRRDPGSASGPPAGPSSDRARRGSAAAGQPPPALPPPAAAAAGAVVQEAGAGSSGGLPGLPSNVVLDLAHAVGTAAAVPAADLAHAVGAAAAVPAAAAGTAAVGADTAAGNWGSPGGSGGAWTGRTRASRGRGGSNRVPSPPSRGAGTTRGSRAGQLAHALGLLGPLAPGVQQQEPLVEHEEQREPGDGKGPEGEQERQQQQQQVWGGRQRLQRRQRRQVRWAEQQQEERVELDDMDVDAEGRDEPGSEQQAEGEAQGQATAEGEEGAEGPEAESGAAGGRGSGVAASVTAVILASATRVTQGPSRFMRWLQTRAGKH